MANSISLDAFVRGVKRLWPRATVWTKGDAAHQGSSSDHNNDDTAGSKPEQTDADSKPEVRAGDIPLLGGVTMGDLDELRVRLTTRPANQRRLRYVILRQSIWRKRNGWKQEAYGGEYHNHLHASIDAADDDNGAAWDIDPAAPQQQIEGDDMARMVYAVGRGWAAVDAGYWRDIDDNDAVLELDEQRVANAFAGLFGNSKEMDPAAWDLVRGHYAATGHVIELPAATA